MSSRLSAKLSQALVIGIASATMVLNTVWPALGGAASGALIGDVNVDGVVNQADIDLIKAHYGASYTAADFNNDNLVNVYDLSLTLKHYGETGTVSNQLRPGVVSGSAVQYSLTGMNKIGGVKYARIEYDISTPAANMASDIAAYANSGIRVLALAGFNGRLPTTAEAQNLGNWAKAYGPGGTFWSGRSDGYLAMKDIEFGNETNMGWQYGDNVGTASFINRAKTYGAMFKVAHMAIQAANSQVGLLAQGDDANSGSSSWIDNVYAGDPDLTSANRVAGWTIHPYGPFDCDPGTTCSRANQRMIRMVQQTAAHGAPSTIPIDITEYGIASKNGVTLSDNYGWPLNLTYAQAGTDLTNTLNSFTSSSLYGNRIRYFMVYGICDLDYTDPNDIDREHFFGVLDHNFNDKGSYTTAVRTIMNMGP